MSAGRENREDMFQKIDAFVLAYNKTAPLFDRATTAQSNFLKIERLLSRVFPGHTIRVGLLMVLVIDRSLRPNGVKPTFLATRRCG